MQYNDGRTPLYAACMNNHLETVDLLLKYDFIIKGSGVKCNNSGYTPILHACKYQNGKVFDLLVKQEYIIKENGNMTDTYGESLLYIACYNRNIKWLIVYFHIILFLKRVEINQIIEAILHCILPVIMDT